MNVFSQSLRWGAASVATLAFFTNHATGALLVSDSFEASATADNANGVYATGNLIGQNPTTTGFVGANNWGANSNAGINYTVQSPGLSVAGYGGSGGSLSLINSSNAFRQAFRAYAPGTTPSGLTEFYASVLLNRTTDNPEFLTSVNISRSGSTGGGPLDFGVQGDQYSVNYRTTGGNAQSTTANSGGAYIAGETVLLVLKVVIDGAEGDDDQWYLFANPDTSTTPINSTAVLSGTGQLWDSDTQLDSTAFRFIEFGSASATESVVFDEIRVATDFESLVPEPGSLALVGMGSLLMFRRRSA